MSHRKPQLFFSGAGGMNWQMYLNMKWFVSCWTLPARLWLQKAGENVCACCFATCCCLHLLI